MKLYCPKQLLEPKDFPGAPWSYCCSSWPTASFLHVNPNPAHIANHLNTVESFQHFFQSVSLCLFESFPSVLKSLRFSGSCARPCQALHFGAKDPRAHDSRVWSMAKHEETKQFRSSSVPSVPSVLSSSHRAACSAFWSTFDTSHLTVPLQSVLQHAAASFVTSSAALDQPLQTVDREEKITTHHKRFCNGRA